MSGRAVVSEAVSDIIVERGDDDTLGALLRNDGARLSRAASETAVERAKANPALHAATVERQSLPVDLLNEMYFVVEARLRHQILEQNARMDPELLEAALAAGRTRVATDDGALPADYAENLAYVNELHAAGQLTPQVLIRFLRSNGRTPFLIALSKLADIDFHTARGIVERKDLDALSVVCKAAAMDRAVYLTYAVAVLGSEDNPMGKAAAYGRMYGELTRDAALRTLRLLADAPARRRRRNALLTSPSPCGGGVAEAQPKPGWGRQGDVPRSFVFQANAPLPGRPRPVAARPTLPGTGREKIVPPQNKNARLLSEAGVSIPKRSGLFLDARGAGRLAAALAQTHRLGQFRTRLGVVRGDHRIVFGQTPFWRGILRGSCRIWCAGGASAT